MAGKIIDNMTELLREHMDILSGIIDPLRDMEDVPSALVDPEADKLRETHSEMSEMASQIASQRESADDIFTETEVQELLDLAKKLPTMIATLQKHVDANPWSNPPMLKKMRLAGLTLFEDVNAMHRKVNVVFPPREVPLIHPGALGGAMAGAGNAPVWDQKDPYVGKHAGTPGLYYIMHAAGTEPTGRDGGIPSVAELHGVKAGAAWTTHRFAMALSN